MYSTTGLSFRLGKSRVAAWVQSRRHVIRSQHVMCSISPMGTWYTFTSFPLTVTRLGFDRLWASLLVRLAFHYMSIRAHSYDDVKFLMTMINPLPSDPVWIWIAPG
jgi:hypothetical protein